MGKVTFEDSTNTTEPVTIELLPNETILAASWRMGVNIPTRCGGAGQCAWCTQRIRSGIEHVIGLSRYNPHPEDDGSTKAKTCQMLVKDDGHVIIEH